jgi:glycosyltransferase involved in cell wall biosynthesis
MNAKKRLVFVIESLHLGGAEKSLVTLLSNLDYSRYSVDLILFINGGVFEKFIPLEVNVIRDLYPKISFYSRVKYKMYKMIYKNTFHNASLFWKATNACFTKHFKQYDIAISYSQGLATYYTATYINSSKKFTWLNIDYQKAGHSIKFDYPFYLRFNEVITVSPEVKKGLENELFKIDKSLEIDVIKDIIDEKILIYKSQQKMKITFNSNKINIVTVGRLAEQKGMHLAIESCKNLMNKGYKVHWYIVGEGSERTSLERLIKSNKLEHNFTLVGMTENPYPYMKDCDIYVQTSLFEGLGLTVIEASYLNKPIVCTNFPTVYGILEHEKTGLIAEMNAIDIANNIERLILDKNLKKVLIKNLTNKENNDKEISLQKVNELFNKN